LRIPLGFAPPRKGTFVIAEMGSTHDNKLVYALDMIEMAKEAGADAVKAQFWSNPVELAERRHGGRDLAEKYALYQLPESWLPVLAERAQRFQIEFMCTAYMPQDIAVVAPYVSRYKVASFEATDTEFLLAHPGDKELIVSTGMMTDEDINQLISTVPHARLLHCVSGYPTPLQEVNLANLADLCISGFSDHSRIVEMGSWAVMMGASIIEVHFHHPLTSINNPDRQGHAHDVESLGKYIQLIRDAEEAIGSRGRMAQPSEFNSLQYRVIR
jgi:sialic acid synthase SpsE